jgi:choline dehydrogenase-like flavoprotein
MKKIKTDICIVGTGFSGTFIASRLKGTSNRILLVDRGAYLSRDRVEDNFFQKYPSKTARYFFKRIKNFLKPPMGIYDDPEFSHYDHANNGKDAFSYSGHHAVGGNSLLWFGNALRKVPNDFRTKSIYGFGVDWPISYNDLEEYYYQAEVEMGVSGPPKDAFTTFRKEPFPFPPFWLSPGNIELNRIFNGTSFQITPSHKARLPIDTAERSACCGAGTCTLFCPADARYNCLTTHLKDLRQSKQVGIHDKVTVSRLIQKDDNIVEAVGFDREGNEIRIEAEVFILAANAIENARILLLSQFHHLKTGFKSKSQAIGKYLTDQVGIWIQAKLPYNLYSGYEKTLQSGHSLSFYDGPFRERYSGIIAEVFWGIPFPNTDKAQKIVINQIKQGYFGNNLREKVFRNSLGKFRLSLEMEMMSEERNRVKLHNSRKNRFGDPIAEFHFSIWDQDYLKSSWEFYSKLFKKMVEGVGGHLGYIAPRNSFEHMLGTCRMGIDPRKSVVDENLKSHNHKNLYIVGGSAFPTAGITNPTLTIAALSLRCGNHLRKTLK